jgi:hypothetical protein
MKKIITVSILILIILASTIGYFYFRSSSTDGNSGIINSLSNLFPTSSNRNISVDGQFPNTTGSDEQNGQNSNQDGINSLSSKFQKISSNSIAGASSVTLKATSTKALPTSAIWYVERATGYVFSFNPDTSQQTQLSNTTWIGGQEVYWGEVKNNPTFILRRSKNSAIENYLAKISITGSSTNSVGELTGITINPDISTLTVSPSKDRFAFLISSPSGSIGYISSFTGDGSPVQIFTSPYAKWQIAWPEENTLIFQSAPLSDQNGLIYSFNLKTKTLTRLLGGVTGLTTLVSPDGKKILYAGNRLDLKVKNLSQKISDLTLGVSTLPEKCTWAKDSINIYCSVPNSTPLGNYPDAWYQGLVSFSDSFWAINTTTGVTKQIYDPTQATEKYQIDGIKLFLSKNENKLFLTNKTDYTLWQLELFDSFNASSTANSN